MTRTKSRSRKKNTTLMLRMCMVVFLVGFSYVLAAHYSKTAEAQNEAPASADEAAPFSEDETRVFLCSQAMETVISEKQREYAQFLNEHFQNEKPTSYLMDIGVERYRQYRKELLSAYRDNIVAQEGANIAGEFFQPEACAAVVDEELFAAREVLKAHIIQNSQAKQTTRLVDYYKLLNEKLGDMHFSVSELYGYFQLFADKVPCFATGCVRF